MQLHKVYTHCAVELASEKVFMMKISKPAICTTVFVPFAIYRLEMEVSQDLKLLLK